MLSFRISVALLPSTLVNIKLSFKFKRIHRAKAEEGYIIGHFWTRRI